MTTSDEHPFERLEREKANTERRTRLAEVRAEGHFITGHAMVWNTRAKIGDFDEMFVPGAFAESLLAGDRHITALLHHDPSKVIGRYVSRRRDTDSPLDSLGLLEDARGLAFSIRVGKTQAAVDAFHAVQEGLINGASVGFFAQEEKWEGRTRIVTKAKLMEISLTAFPAYESTSVSARNRIARAPTNNARRITLLDLEGGQ